MRPLPTTIEILESHALREPHRPALREEDSELTYADLYGMVAQCALHLQRLGVARGDRVAVSGPGFGLQLVMLLAGEGIGAVTATFQAEDDVDAEFLFTQVQWVFSARPQQVPEGVRFQQLDAAFARSLAQPLAGARPAWRGVDWHEPLRIARTSGSSGRSKFMVLPRAAQEYAITTGREKEAYGPGTRLLVLGPFVMNAALARASVCLRRGGMVLAPVGGAQLPALAPTHVWGLPAQLQRLLSEAPADWRAPQPVPVATVGGAVAPALRAQVARVFQSAVQNRYGSNEAGNICGDLDADGSGWLNPGVDVRILGPDGADLAQGELGAIAVRTPGLVDGYLGRPEESAAAFRDGWFVSGDIGRLLAPRRLQLVGRHDDLVNIGGLKVPTREIEAQLRARDAVADCAALAVNVDDSAATLGIALVLAPGASSADAGALVRAALQLPADTVLRLLVLPALPRLANGKVDRLALVRCFRAET